MVWEARVVKCKISIYTLFCKTVGINEIIYFKCVVDTVKY